MPWRFTMFFSQEAQDMPPRGFLVNMASSSFSPPWLRLDMKRSYKFLICFSRSFRAFLVSFLSANFLESCSSNSLIRSNSNLSKFWRASMSALPLRLSWKSLNNLEISLRRLSNSYWREASLASRSWMMDSSTPDPCDWMMVAVWVEVGGGGVPASCAILIYMSLTVR